MNPDLDAKSVRPEYLHVAEQVQLLVLGGGPAGVAAAIEAAKGGVSVMLIDEHPVDPVLMGLDVPFHFGQRMDASVQNRERTLRQIVSTHPTLEEAFLAGVDIRLATDVWGLFANCADVAWLKRPMAGLADGTRSWMVGFERAVIAAGRRDLGIAFPGWQLPGVVGITAAAMLLQRYDAFTGRSLVVLGSSTESLSFALHAHKVGLAIKAVVEVADKPLGAERLVSDVRRAGIPLLLCTIPLAAEGEDEICALRLVRIDASRRPVPGTEQTISCDTICLGIGVVPNVEAIDALGGELIFRDDRGGYVPLLDSAMRTSIAHVFAAGDCTGITPDKSLDPDIAQTEGKSAARGAIASLSAGAHDEWHMGPSMRPPLPLERRELFANLTLWLRAIGTATTSETVICQCEEVARADLLSIDPPRYLNCPASRAGHKNLASMRLGNALSQDQIKRLTRAGMGYCQGRRCREQTAVLMAIGADVPIENIKLSRFRPPLRPLPLSVLQESDFHANLAANWEVWFGIESQWTPYWALKVPSQAREAVTYGK
jgi:thioredoxin reductase